MSIRKPPKDFDLSSAINRIYKKSNISSTSSTSSNMFTSSISHSNSNNNTNTFNVRASVQSSAVNPLRHPINNNNNNISTSLKAKPITLVDNDSNSYKQHYRYSTSQITTHIKNEHSDDTSNNGYTVL